LKLRNIRTNDFSVDESNVVTWYHPERYFRAAVADVVHDGQTVGMIDMKGTGQSWDDKVDNQVRCYQTLSSAHESLNALRIADHSDGLMSLGEAIAESTRQKAVQ